LDGCQAHVQVAREIVAQTRPLAARIRMATLEQAMLDEDSPCLSSHDILASAWEKAAKTQVSLVVNGLPVEAGAVYMCRGLEKGQVCHDLYVDDTPRLLAGGALPLIPWPRSGEALVQVQKT
jgi:hypothetical protein